MYKLYTHQENALAFLEMNPEGLLIAYDVGTGKTMIALEYLHRRMKQGTLRNALVICPASMVGSWERAIDDCVMFEGFTPEDVEQMKKIVFVTSYQKTFRTHKETHKDAHGKEVEKRVIEIREEVDRLWDVVICDESHALGGHASAQTKVCGTIARHSKTRIAMSGTPLHGGGGQQDWEKMFGQIQFITAETKWKNWTAFIRDLVIEQNQYHAPVSWRDEKCNAIFQDYTIACRRNDCIDLPPKVESERLCPLVEKKIYNDIKTGKIDKYNITCSVAGAQYGKLLQVVSGSCKTDTEVMTFKTSKDEVLEELLTGSNEKVIVFCRYTASIDRCMAVANKIGRKAVSFDGRSKGETWRQLQDGNSDLLVVQYDSGSAGLNLQAAHICVFYEPTLSALKLEQAAGRIYRSGQKEKCVYYYLITPNTIEEKVWRKVRAGVDVNNEMLEEMANGTL